MYPTSDLAIINLYVHWLKVYVLLESDDTPLYLISDSGLIHTHRRVYNSSSKYLQTAENALELYICF